MLPILNTEVVENIGGEEFLFIGLSNFLMLSFLLPGLRGSMVSALFCFLLGGF